MTYEEIVAKAKEELGSADVSKYEGHLALQFNITGEGEGIFYAEILDGKLYIEPYDYKDNDATLTAEGNDIISILTGALDPMKAFEDGKLTFSGDAGKLLSIQPIIEANKKPAKKTAAKKPAAKTVTTTAEKPAKKTSKKAAKDETPVIIGLSDPKKAPVKSAAKTAAKSAAKESTKPAKSAPKTTAKKG